MSMFDNTVHEVEGDVFFQNVLCGVHKEKHVISYEINMRNKFTNDLEPRFSVIIDKMPFKNQFRYEDRETAIKEATDFINNKDLKDEKRTKDRKD